MSQDGFWDSDEAMSEAEVSSAVAEIEQQSLYEDKDSNESFDEETTEDFEADLEVLKNARLRLEQGKLYEMLLKHNLFEGVDAEPKAIANVQKELRAFIKERLEVLVGLRPDPRLKPAQQMSEAVAGLSDVEMQVLKEFLGKAVGSKKTEIVKNTQTKILNPIKSGNANVKVNPVKNSKPAPKTKNEEGPGLTKPPSQMTIEELREYNKNISMRQKGKKPITPSKKLPMPDSEQSAKLYISRIQSDPGQGVIGAILSKMNKPLGIIEDVGDGGINDDSNDSRM